MMTEDTSMMFLAKEAIQHLLLVQVVHIMEKTQQLGDRFQILELRKI